MEDVEENITTSKVLSSTRTVTLTPGSLSKRTDQKSTVSTFLPATSLSEKSSLKPLSFNKTTSLGTLAATTATPHQKHHKPVVVPPTGDSKITGHQPTLSALLTKTTTATTKISTTIQTTPSSSSSPTPVAPSTSDKSRYTCPQNFEPNYQTFIYRDHCFHITPSSPCFLQKN
ncbi:mucin-5B-like [Lingula anatina]|uniref:Mucin-5B-like n=1 Tax=Lingula anatina TaxID=7574 RepID=A0A1S3HH88_LINAN|nr:mucin-5B-like [Lingula anatina]|eukprot:XP_013385448.1 mucin-5B-like [Lingula anatina]